jgi:membrane protein
MASFKQSWDRFRKFISQDIWEMDVTSLSARRSLPIRLLRVAQLVLKGFKEDDLPVHASALTFATLMSLVPALAVAFALLKGFGFGQEKVQALLAWTESMPAEFQNFTQTVLTIVSSTNFAAMGWVGLAAVVAMAITVLGSMEMSFDRIWGVQRSRGMVRKVANYVAVLVLVPLLIGVGGTIETTLHGAVPLLPAGVGRFLRSALRLTSLFTTWLAFFSLYTLLPHTKVRALPATLSSVVTAVIWVLWQRAYISLQMGVARYNAIYGTFASIPIFLAWLYTSWVIVLLGAELTFALQNAATYSMESMSVNASARSRITLALAVLAYAADALRGRKPRFTPASFSAAHHVPIRLLNDLVRMLVRAGYLVEVTAPESSYVLARAPETIKLRDVFAAVLEEGAHPERLSEKNIEANVRAILAKVDKGLDGALGERTLADLAAGAP